jgi:hypothetical protein
VVEGRLRRFGACATVSLVALGAPAIAAADRFEAHFTARSYGPGESGWLVIAAPAGRTATVQLFRAGPERGRTTRDDTMRGVPVNDPRRVRAGAVRLAIRHWPPGLYFARVSLAGRVTFAPFVLHASPVFRPRVAVVLPTNTWQAYNLRDDDGDGVANSWYASETVTTVSLARPFYQRGVPPYFRRYDVQFLRWLARTRKDTDFLADDDLEAIRTPASLAARYDLVVFSGHEEYVTPHAFELLTGYRNLGGNLAFLSANNFFYRVSRSGSRLHGRTRWRDVGRPEAALVGVQYVGWYEGIYDQEPYVVRGRASAPWLFKGTGLRNGERFGRFGIEVDARAPSSPSQTVLLARARNIFGPGKSAEMTYYRTARGAKVFAAGVLDFATHAGRTPVDKLVENIFTKLEVR